MVSKTALTAQNLESLGAEALARLLMEISQGDAALKRRLRMELAGLRNPAELAREIRKRLATLARSRSFVDWSGARGLAEDLEILAQGHRREARSLRSRRGSRASLAAAGPRRPHL